MNALVFVAVSITIFNYFFPNFIFCGKDRRGNNTVSSNLNRFKIALEIYDSNWGGYPTSLKELKTESDADNTNWQNMKNPFSEYGEKTSDSPAIIMFYDYDFENDFVKGDNYDQYADILGMRIYSSIRRPVILSKGKIVYFPHGLILNRTNPNYTLYAIDKNGRLLRSQNKIFSLSNSR